MTQNDMVIMQLLIPLIIGGGLGLAGYVIGQLLKKGEQGEKE